MTDIEQTKKLSEFKGWTTNSIWVILLDGKPMRGHKQNAFDTKGGANTSLSLSLRYRCKQYGFSKASEMRQALLDSGRLEIVNIGEELYGTDN